MYGSVGCSLRKWLRKSGKMKALGQKSKQLHSSIQSLELRDMWAENDDGGRRRGHLPRSQGALKFMRL